MSRIYYEWKHACLEQYIVNDSISVSTIKQKIKTLSIIYWRTQWHPTPVLLPGKSHGRRSLVVHAVHEVAKSRTRLSDFTFSFHFHALEKEMATHSSVLAWRIPGTGEPGGLPSMGSHRVGHDWSDLAAAAASYIWLDMYISICICLIIRRIV